MRGQVINKPQSAMLVIIVLYPASPGGYVKCNQRRCDLCKNLMIQSNFFQSFQTGRKCANKSKLSCDLKKRVYLTSCNECFLQYIGSGSTAMEIKVRFRNHKSSIGTNMKTCEVAVHFNESPHILSDFSFQCMDQVPLVATNSSGNLDKLLIMTLPEIWDKMAVARAH